MLPFHEETVEEISVKFAKEIEAVAQGNKLMEESYKRNKPEGMKLTYCIVGDNFGRPGWFIKFPFDAGFLKEFKEISYHLRSWDSDKKTWWVSEECAEELAFLFENWAIAPIIKPSKTSGANGKCLKCGGRGLVPSTVLGKFSGKPIPNCFTKCECRKEEEHEYYPRFKPSDFDFPMSHGWRSYIEEECTGKPLPAIYPQASDLSESPVETSEPKWTQRRWQYVPTRLPEPKWTERQWQYVAQLVAQVNHLKSKVTEMKKSQGEY